MVKLFLKLIFINLAFVIYGFGQIVTVVDEGTTAGGRGIQVGDILYYVKEDPQLGRQVWKADMKTNQAGILKDLGRGSNKSYGSNPTLLRSVDNKYLFFAANVDGASKQTLFVSDGTTAGTVVVSDVDGISSAQSNNYVDGKDFWYAVSLLTGGRYKSTLNRYNTDTRKSSVILDESEDVLMDQIFIQGSKVYYIRRQGGSTGNYELWSCDKDGKNTVRLTVLKKPLASGIIAEPNSQKVYFLQSATTGKDDGEIWETDGTAGGTKKLLDEQAISGKFNITLSEINLWLHQKIGNYLYFRASGLSLYKYNLSTGGMEPVVKKYEQLIENKDALVYAVDEGEMRKIYIESAGGNKSLDVGKDFLPVGIVDNHVYATKKLVMVKINMNSLMISDVNFKYSGGEIKYGKIGNDIIIDAGTNLVDVTSTAKIINRGHTQSSDFYASSDKLFYFSGTGTANTKLYAFSKGTGVKTYDCAALKPKEKYVGPTSICDSSKEYKLDIEAFMDGVGINNQDYSWTKDGETYDKYDNQGLYRILKINQPGIYQATIAYNNGCSYTFSEYAINSKGNLQTGISFPEGLSICKNLRPYLKLVGELRSGKTSDAHTFSYEWRLDGKKITGDWDSFTDTYTTQIDKPGQYTFWVQNKDFCKDSISINIIERAPTETPVISSTATTLKTNESITISTSQTFDLYYWYKDGARISNADLKSKSIQVNSPGKYYLIAESTGKCGSNSNEINIVTSNQTALTATISSATTTVYAPQTIILTANTGTGYSYQWRRNGANIPGATGATYEAKESGTYTVVITANGQSATSNSIVLVVQVPLAKEPEVSGMTVRVFPNPAERQVNAEINLSEELPVRVEIFTADGRRVKLWHSEGKHFVHRPVIALGSGLEGQQLLLKVSTDKSFVTQKIHVK